MALAVCLLFDRRGDALVRGLWARLEAAGIGTLQTHTHGRHHPHLSYAVLLEWDLDEVVAALSGLPDEGSFPLSCQGSLVFPRGRTNLGVALAPAVFVRQQRVVEALRGTSAVVHRHYDPGHWLPHVSLAGGVHAGELATVVTAVSDSLPLVLTAERAVLIDTLDGRVWPLPVVP